MNDVIVKTEAFVRKEMGTDATGHDWHHIQRVLENARRLRREIGKGDLFIIEMAALLHDIPDRKLNRSEEEGWKKLLSFLETVNLPAGKSRHIISCISSVSFKNGNGSRPETIEAEIVQDADRLDALGAVGIARTFAYGGYKGQMIHLPEAGRGDGTADVIPPLSPGTSVGHFYEKLLKLKDQMNTAEARKHAQKRHDFMVEYLQRFYNEWNGID